MSEGIVIADYHHAGLFQSLMYLFEKRLGFELCRPCGWEWWEAGLKHPDDKVSNIGFIHDELSFQSSMLKTPSFLHHTEVDKIQALSVPVGRTISLQEAKDRASEVKFFITSQHDTQTPIWGLMNQFWPNAHLIRQCGNPDEHVYHTKHVLSSDLKTYNRIKDTHHVILYHQEFNLGIYKVDHHEPISPQVNQYINWAHNDKINRAFYLWFKTVAMKAGLVSHEHGRGGEDGEMDYHFEIARLMQNSTFTLSHKWWDGYGMIVHQSYACGRPVICFADDYTDKLGKFLMEDMLTAVFISQDDEMITRKLQVALQRAPQMQEAARQRFEEVVNFNEEEKEIRKWLSQI